MRASRTNAMPFETTARDTTATPVRSTGRLGNWYRIQLDTIGRTQHRSVVSFAATCQDQEVDKGKSPCAVHFHEKVEHGNHGDRNEETHRLATGASAQRTGATNRVVLSPRSFNLPPD